MLLHWDLQLFALIEVSLVLLRMKRALGKFNSTWFRWEGVPVRAGKDAMLMNLLDALKDNRALPSSSSLAVLTLKI